MEQIEEKNLPALVSELQVLNVEQTFAEMQLSSSRAVTALKAYKSITNDEEDTAAEALLVKVRKTFEKVEASRKSITSKFDEIKAVLMAPEKDITNDAKVDNEYARVKKLRDAYANQKFQAEQKRLADIQKKKEIDTEKATVKAAFENQFELGILSANKEMSNKVSEAFVLVNLETLPKLEEKLSKPSVLKFETYEGWFTQPKFNATLITDEDVETIEKEVRAVKTYELACEKYKDLSSKTLEDWSDKIPELKKALESSSQSAAEEIAQKAAEEQEEKQSVAEKAAEHKAETNTQAQQLGASFNAQIEAQVGATKVGGKVVKKAVIESCNQDFVATISELFFSVFTHPKYPGVIKTDKKGVQQFNEDGSPIYVDWLDSILSFYANNCETNIPGIKVSESISTVQKKK